MKQYKLLITLPKGSIIVWDDKFNVYNGVIEEIKEECKRCECCGKFHSLISTERVKSCEDYCKSHHKPQEECRHKAAATVDNYFMCPECGICHYIKPHPKQKPSEWIKEREKQIFVEEGEISREWVENKAIIDYLDEHFSK